MICEACPVCGHVYTRRIVWRGKVAFGDCPQTTLRTENHAACVWCLERAARLGVWTWEPRS